MLHTGKEVLVHLFNSAENPLRAIRSNQSNYLYAYLAGLNAVSVVEEQNYFDRDYLDEFSVFYSKSSRGYPNICRRIHFFSENITKDALKAALANDDAAVAHLQGSYLGFSVLRPINAAPLGRTVLRWYPPNNNDRKRVIAPSREYSCNIGGLILKVRGLAWQQQDTGVAACATIGVWTMLHSSAFDAHHSIPTTAAITLAAHDRASLGDRVFPSKGLKPFQILEAIKAQNLTPLICLGDISNKEGPFPLFSKKKFAVTCSAFVRSGYPVILIGKYLTPTSNMGHLVCAVGFKEPAPPDIAPGSYEAMDSGTDIFYLHDDNIGPNVRFQLTEGDPSNRGQNVALLESSPPEYVSKDLREPKTNFVFVPELLIIAVHEELRISSDEFHNAASILTQQITNLLTAAYTESKETLPKVAFSSRFLNIRDYMSAELVRVFKGRFDLLGKVRLALIERVPPMSLHLGLIRIAIYGNDNGIELVMDILCDTSDSDRNQPIFAHIVYDPVMANLLSKIDPETVKNTLGEQIIAY